MKITRRRLRRIVKEAMQARYDHPVYGTVSDEEAEQLATNVGRMFKRVGPGQYKAVDDPYWSSPAGKIEKEMRALKLKIKSFMDQLKDVQENGPRPGDPPSVEKILKKSIMDDTRKFKKLQADLEAESRKGTPASRFPPTQMAVSEASSKITRKQLRRIIREAVHGADPRETARDIMRHYDSIASDVGEIYVDDLIDHWYGQGNPEPGPGVRAALIRMNNGSAYFGEVDLYGGRDDDGSGGFGSGGAPARFGR